MTQLQPKLKLQKNKHQEKNLKKIICMYIALLQIQIHRYIQTKLHQHQQAAT